MSGFGCYTDKNRNNNQRSFSDEPKDCDKLMEKQFGQDVIDSLSVLKVTASTLHSGLHHRLVELLPKLTLALRSKFAIIRQCAAKCFATICGVITVGAMRHVIERIVPLLGDALSVSNRQGAMELIYRKHFEYLTILRPNTSLIRRRARIGYQSIALCHLLGRTGLG